MWSACGANYFFGGRVGLDFLCFLCNVKPSEVSLSVWKFPHTFPPKVWSPFVQPGPDITYWYSIFNYLNLSTNYQQSTRNRKIAHVTSYSYVTWMLLVVVYSSRIFFGTGGWRLWKKTPGTFFSVILNASTKSHESASGNAATVSYFPNKSRDGSSENHLMVFQMENHDSTTSISWDFTSIGTTSFWLGVNLSVTAFPASFIICMDQCCS